MVLTLFAQSNVESQVLSSQSVDRCQIGPHCWKCIRLITAFATSMWKGFQTRSLSWLKSRIRRSS